jgi:enamine deaminase RidA (YjgF/YER057c/UK114 family)
MSYNQKFNSLQDLPPLSEASSNTKYVPSRVNLRTLTLSGNGPLRGATIPKKFTGSLGKEVSVKEGYAAARLTGMNLLLAAQEALGTLDIIDHIVSIDGFVSSADDFYDQSSVIDGCSDLMIEIFGDNGQHTRSAIGTNVLAFNICVEISMTLVIK